MLGGSTGRNLGFVAGAGTRPPKAPAHMQASCPADPSAPCDARSALFAADAAGLPNPGVIAGALVAGPGADDGYADRPAAPGARVGAHNNAPQHGAARRRVPGRGRGTRGGGGGGGGGAGARRRGGAVAVGAATGRGRRGRGGSAAALKSGLGVKGPQSLPARIFLRHTEEGDNLEGCRG